MEELYVYEWVKEKKIRRKAKRVFCERCNKEKLVRLDRDYKYCKRCTLTGCGNPMFGKIPHNAGERTFNDKEYKKSYYANKRKNNRANAISFLGNKCWKCGVENLPICCWDIHHLDPNEKEKSVSLLFAYGWERVLNEIKKCVLVCAHCHRIIHNGEETLDALCD